MKAADRGWLTIGAFVIFHNVLQAGRGKPMLSERADDWIAARPILTRTLIALVALHVANGIPRQLDVCGWLFMAGEKLPLILGKPNRRL